MAGIAPFGNSAVIVRSLVASAAGASPGVGVFVGRDISLGAAAAPGAGVSLFDEVPKRAHIKGFDLSF